MKNQNKTVLIASLFMLAACDGTTVQEKLGISRPAPDEFSVIARPPLTVPPEFDLKPPQKYSKSLSQTDTSGKVQNILQGRDENQDVKSTATPDALTKSEQNLLEKAGASQANPDIRQAIEQDEIVKQQKKSEKKGLVSGWFGKDKADDVEKPSPETVEKKAEEKTSEKPENKSNQ